jgi:hypothetical protein
MSEVALFLGNSCHTGRTTVPPYTDIMPFNPILHMWFRDIYFTCDGSLLSRTGFPLTLTLFYTHDLEIVILHVMVPQP